MPFDKGLATVALGGKWGLIDTNGSFVVQLQFDYDPLQGFAPIFSEGLDLR
jgi:hypothetical protein